MEHPDHPDNAPGLGELPADLRKLRGTLYPDEVLPIGPPTTLTEIPGARPGVPPQPPELPYPNDVVRAQAAERASQNIPAGTPSTAFVVQTTFDARPINANDFRGLGAIALKPLADPATTSGTYTFTVPSGKVAILRRVEWTPDVVLQQGALDADSLPAFDPAFVLSPLVGSVTVAGQVARTYEVVVEQLADFEMYAIAQEGEKIIVRVDTNAVYDSLTGFPAGYAPTVVVKIHGNLLETKGREKQYSPANTYQGGNLV